MPERHFSIPRLTSFLRLVLVPIGMFGDLSRAKCSEYMKNKKAGYREAWLKALGSPCVRHGVSYATLVAQELERTELRCVTHPNDDLFADRKNGTPWGGYSIKQRLDTAKLACLDVGISIEPFLSRSKDSSQGALRSRNWANSKEGVKLIQGVRMMESRGKIKPTKAMTPKENIDWVAENVDANDVSLDDAPNGACRLLLQVARSDRGKFATEYMRLAYKSTTPVTPPDESPKDAAEASLDSILLSVGNDE